MRCQRHLVETKGQQSIGLRDHLVLVVVREESVPGGPAHGRGGVEAVREGRYPMEEGEEGEEGEKHVGEQMRSEQKHQLIFEDNSNQN